MNKCECCQKFCNQELASYDYESKIICDNCNQYFEWCNVCKTSHDVHFNTPCRHLFWDEYQGFWGGFGIDPLDWKAGKEPIIAALDTTGKDFAVRLKMSLLAHKYCFNFYGCIFGVERVVCDLLEDNGKISPNHALNRVFSIKDSEQQRKAASGINWLVSLWAGRIEEGWDTPETIEADIIVAGWVDEWLGVAR